MRLLKGLSFIGTEKNHGIKPWSKVKGTCFIVIPFSQAEDFERRIIGPRREQKLQEMEDKMSFIRGFKGKGQVLGGGAGPPPALRGRAGQRSVQQSGAHGKLDHRSHK